MVFPALTDTPFGYDPEKARQILADAGVETPINVTMDDFGSDLCGNGASHSGVVCRGASIWKSFPEQARK